MVKVLTKLYDTVNETYTEKWLTKEEFENLSNRYCLPYEVAK